MMSAAMLSTTLTYLFPLSLLGGPLLMGCVGLSIAVWIVLGAGDFGADARAIIACAGILMIPLAARVCGQLLDSFLGEGHPHQSRLSTLAAVAAFTLMLSGAGVVPAIETAAALKTIPTESEMLGWCSRLGAAALFCAFLSGAVVSSLALLVELPARLVMRGGRVDLRLPYPALRQGMVIIAVVLALDLMGGMLVRELDASFLISLLKGA